MSDSSPQGNDTVSVAPKPNKFKTIFFAVLAASIVVIALSITLISTSWSSYGDAKSAVETAETRKANADAEVAAANAYYDIADSAYWDWYDCYWSTSYYWDWVCGSESVFLSDLEYAESAVADAKGNLQNARMALGTANSELDDAANQFNQSVWIWGIASGLALIALAVVGVIAARNRRTQEQLEKEESRPDWDCPECSTHNEGGMFCVGCGFSKADAKAKTKSKTAEEVVEPEE